MPMTTSNNTKSDGGLLPKTVVLPSSDGELTNMPMTTANNPKSDGGLLPKTVVLPSSDGELTNMPMTTSNNTKSDGGLLPKTVVPPSSDGGLTNGTPKLEHINTTARVEKIQLLRKIAAGGFGETYEAIFNNQPVCIKKLINDEFEEALSNEHRVMQACDHPHLLRSLALIRDGPELTLVLPLLNTDALRWTQSDDWNFDKSKLFATQLMDGLTYMHHNNLNHNDIKPENCLINSTQDNLLLADFGLSSSCSIDEFLAGKPRGTLAYFAPEQLLSDAKQCQLSDVWSAALTVFVIVSREDFFADENPLDRLDQTRIYERIDNQVFTTSSVRRALRGGLQVALRNRRSSEEIWDVLKEENARILLKKTRLSSNICITKEGKKKGGDLMEFFKNNFPTQNVLNWTIEVSKMIKRLLRYISIPIRQTHFEIVENLAASEAFSVCLVHGESNPIKVYHNLGEVLVNENRIEYIINELVSGMAQMLAHESDDSVTEIEARIHAVYRQKF